MSDQEKQETAVRQESSASDREEAVPGREDQNGGVSIPQTSS